MRLKRSFRSTERPLQLTSLKAIEFSKWKDQYNYTWQYISVNNQKGQLNVQPKSKLKWTSKTANRMYSSPNNLNFSKQVKRPSKSMAKSKRSFIDQLCKWKKLSISLWYVNLKKRNKFLFFNLNFQISSFYSSLKSYSKNICGTEEAFLWFCFLVITFLLALKFIF